MTWDQDLHQRCGAGTGFAIKIGGAGFQGTLVGRLIDSGGHHKLGLLCYPGVRIGPRICLKTQQSRRGVWAKVGCRGVLSQVGLADWRENG